MAGSIIWVGALLLLVGYFVYRTDKKIKEKYQDKFNHREWDLSDAAPQVPQKPTAPALASTPVPTRPQLPSYHRQPQWFTSAQVKMYRLLQQALAGDYVLLAKIQLGDLVTAPAILAERVQRRVDFAVCSPQDLAPLCLVTLEETVLELRQLEEICRSVQLPLVKVAAGDALTSPVLRQQLLAAMGVVLDADHKNCPLCGAAMRQRQINSGAQAGRRVWVCSSYPACKGWQAIS